MEIAYTLIVLGIMLLLQNEKNKIMEKSFICTATTEDQLLKVGDSVTLIPPDTSHETVPCNIDYRDVPRRKMKLILATLLDINRSLPKQFSYEKGLGEAIRAAEELLQEL